VTAEASVNTWTRIEAQLTCAPGGIEGLRLVVAILCWRVCDLVSFGASIAILVAVFRTLGDASFAVDLILILIARSLLWPLAWLLLPDRPHYG